MSRSNGIRIGVLATLSLLGLLCLARVSVGEPNERHPLDSFEFPPTIELDSLGEGRRIETEKIRATGRLIAEANYAFSTPFEAFEIRAAYFSSGDAKAHDHATNSLGISEFVRQSTGSSSGPMVLRHSTNQFTFTACLLPGGEVVTTREEMELILADRPVTLKRLISNVTGTRAWVDERYLWTAITVTTTTSAADPVHAIEFLESAWGEWRAMWARTFPER